MLKRHKVEIEREQDPWSDWIWTSLISREDPKGNWVLAEDVKKLEDKIKRMQRRIDKLEGRIQ